MGEEKNLWDINQAAKYCEISRQLLYFYIKRGDIIPFIDIPKHRLFRKADVQDFRKWLKKHQF